MKQDRIAFGAATMRFVLAAFGAWIVPILFPTMATQRWVFAAYAGIAILQQFLIWRDIGGSWRPFLGGVLDVALVTFLVQRVGSTRTMVVSAYFVLIAVSSLVVRPRVSMALSVIAAAMYFGVVVAEIQGWIPFAPDGEPWVKNNPTTATYGLAAATLVGLLLIATAAIVGVLTTKLSARESELLSVNERLAELTRQDPLTKLWNRRHILHHIEQGLAWLNRGRPMAVVMIDLDQFKRVNDIKGHLEGDELLKNIATALRRSTREVDIAGRYGGDEFVIVLPDTNQDEGRVAANRFVAAIREVGREFEADNPVTASAGLSIARPGDTVATVLKRADDFAYTAKKQGGNRLCG